MPEAPGPGRCAFDADVRSDGFYARYLKRCLDILLAAFLLIAAMPLLAALGLGVLLFLGRPVLFRQVRTGRNGAPILLMKFRSMRHAAHAGEPDGVRLSQFGRWLRASGLDELPQLLHVLRGDMSLVGPRPLPPEYDCQYSPRERTRLRVRPGLLGLAQSRGRNALDWDEKLEWDARYAERVTFLGDVTAALGSLAVVLCGRGVHAPNHATSPALRAGAEPASSNFPDR